MSKLYIFALVLCCCLLLEFVAAHPRGGSISNTLSVVSTANVKDDPNLRSFTNYAEGKVVQKDLYYILCECGPKDDNSSSAGLDDI